MSTFGVDEDELAPAVVRPDLGEVILSSPNLSRFWTALLDWMISQAAIHCVGDSPRFILDD
jgi:hypothetical protein